MLGKTVGRRAELQLTFGSPRGVLNAKKNLKRAATGEVPRSSECVARGVDRKFEQSRSAGNLCERRRMSAMIRLERGS